MTLINFFDRIEQLFFNYGLFSSRHPISMIIFSAVMILSCCYPLINLPIPGSEPQQFLTAFEDLKDTSSIDTNHGKMYKDSPSWFSYNNQTAFIQQFVVKILSDPTIIKGFKASNSYKASLDYVFPILDEIKTFSIDENVSVAQDCFPITDTVIKTKQSIKSIFPENGCLIISPAAYWKNQRKSFTTDANIHKTIDQYESKTLKTPPSIKELLFGITSKQIEPKSNPYIVTFAITLVLKKYDAVLINGLKQKLYEVYSEPEVSKYLESCAVQVHNKNGIVCANLSQTVTNIRYFPQMRFNDLSPLLLSYFVIGCYIYFSVKKINFVKSKLGMALCAVVSVLASLMMAVGLCSLIGLTPTFTRGQPFPYIVCFIGLENILVITKSVVATHTHLDVDKRIAVGLSREGSSIIKNLLLEFFIVGLGLLAFVPEVKEFCAFAIVGISSDFFINMLFFVPVLSIDIKRLDTEDPYPYEPNTSDESGEETNPVYPPPSKSVKKRSRATRQRSTSRRERVDSIEIGGRAKILRIPRRLRLVFFFADKRLIQRGLMVFVVLWFSYLLYCDPAGILTNPQINIRDQKFQTGINFDKVHYGIEFSDFETSQKSPIKWTFKDLLSYHYLSFRHWPTLFSYYNVTLAERYISILPSIPVSISLTQSSIERLNNLRDTKTESPFYQEHLNIHLPSHFYTGGSQWTGFDYYMTLIIGAVSGILMLLLLNFMYHCICSRNYARWRFPKKEHTGHDTNYSLSNGDSVPLLLSGHSQLVDCVHVEGVTITSADITGEIRTWDSHSGECTSVISRKRKHMVKETIQSIRQQNSVHGTSTFPKNEILGPSIWSVVTSGQFIFVGCSNGHLEVWDIVSGSMQCKHVSSKGGIVGLGCEDGRVVVARITGTLDFFVIEDNSCKQPFRGSLSDMLLDTPSDLNLQLIHTVKSAHQQPISAFEMCMQRVLTGSCDHTIKLFNFQDAKCQFSMFGHTGPVTVLYMEKQAPLSAVSGSSDGTVRLWDLVSGVCSLVFEGHQAPISAAQCSMHHVVSTAQDDKMCIWNRRTGTLLHTKTLHPGCSCAMNLFGEKLCVTGGKGDLILWDVRSGDLLRRIPLLNDSVVQPTVQQVHVSTDFCIVCVLGHELLVARFPAVLEKN